MLPYAVNGSPNPRSGPITPQVPHPPEIAAGAAAPLASEAIDPGMLHKDPFGSYAVNASPNPRSGPITPQVIYSDEDRKFNKEITVSLICSELLNLAEFNVHLAKFMDGGRNKAATELTIAFVDALLLREPGFYAELYKICDVLAKLAAKSGSQELFQLQELIEITRNTVANSNPLSSFAFNKEEKVKQSRDKKVLPGRTLTNREEYSVTESASGDPAGFSDKLEDAEVGWNIRISDFGKWPQVFLVLFVLFTTAQTGEAACTCEALPPSSTSTEDAPFGWVYPMFCFVCIIFLLPLFLDFVMKSIRQVTRLQGFRFVAGLGGIVGLAVAILELSDDTWVAAMCGGLLSLVASAVFCYPASCLSAAPPGGGGGGGGSGVGGD